MRRVLCSRCSHNFQHGTTRVLRFVVFHFCSRCWRHRAECEAIMQAVA